MHHPTDRITHTTAVVTPVMEHRLEREIAQLVIMKDQSNNPSHHEQTFLPQSYISLLSLSCPRHVQWGKVWARCWHCIDVVLLEMSTDIVILKNKTSTRTPSNHNNKGCRYVILVVLPSDPSLHNAQCGERFYQS